jgi:hypothetical protein
MSLNKDLNVFYYLSRLLSLFYIDNFIYYLSIYYLGVIVNLTPAFFEYADENLLCIDVSHHSLSHLLALNVIV